MSKPVKALFWTALVGVIVSFGMALNVTVEEANDPAKLDPKNETIPVPKHGG